jgi:hypothetical protein
MIQDLWQIDFLGIFLSRLLISTLLFILGIRAWKENKIFVIFSIFSSILNFLGAFSSFISIIWILFLFFKISIKRKFELLDLALVSYFILILFIGPGKLSIDRVFNLRW